MNKPEFIDFGSPIDADQLNGLCNIIGSLTDQTSKTDRFAHCNRNRMERLKIVLEIVWSVDLMVSRYQTWDRDEDSTVPTTSGSTVDRLYPSVGWPGNPCLW